jgi:hypothetical protein
LRIPEPAHDGRRALSVQASSGRRNARATVRHLAEPARRGAGVRVEMTPKRIERGRHLPIDVLRCVDWSSLANGPLTTPPGLVKLLVAGSLLQSLGEEPGWRGWFLPKLRERFGQFAATLVLFPVWLLWHLLINATRGVAIPISTPASLDRKVPGARGQE